MKSAYVKGRRLDYGDIWHPVHPGLLVFDPVDLTIYLYGLRCDALFV